MGAWLASSAPNDAINDTLNADIVDGPCEIPSCQALIRIGKLVQYYVHYERQRYKQFRIHSNEQTQQTKTLSIHDYIHTNGTIVTLLNNFHHLLFDHSREFEDIYEYFVGNQCLHKCCDKTKCILLQRNNRNRSKCATDTRIRDQLFYDMDCVKEISACQTLDKIHCYFLHSFDHGYKLRLNEYAIDNNEHHMQECMSIIKSKSNKTEKQSVECTKFVSNESLFSYGTQYIYPSWNEFKIYKNQANEQKQMFLEHDKDVTSITETNLYNQSVRVVSIDYKYQSFKTELRHNQLSTLAAHVLNTLVQDAANHLATNYCRKYQPEVKQANGTTRREEPEYPFVKSEITIEHLLAIMVYCGYDAISTVFTSTHRRLETDTDDNSLIDRHRELAHFGRYLAEACYYFDDVLVPGQAYYHGIDHEMYFVHINMKLYHPFSITASFHVAIGFSQPGGFVLTLEDMLDTIDCRCSWISPFVHEQESLIFATNGICIVDLCDVKNGTAYAIYFAALDIISSFVVGSPNFLTTYGEGRIGVSLACQLVYRILMHELAQAQPNDTKYHPFKSMPRYIRELFHRFCVSQVMITLSTSLFQSTFEDGGYEWLSNLNLNDLKVLVSLFPHLKVLKFTENDGFECRELVEDVLQFLEKERTIKGLNHIEFIHCDCTWEVENTIGMYTNEFKQVGWEFKIVLEPMGNLSFNRVILNKFDES
eukprot:332117_1